MAIQVRRSLILALTVLVLASLACGSFGSGEPVAEEAPTQPAVELAPPTDDWNPTEEASVSTAGPYDGSWTGTNTVDDKEILFDVMDNQVTSIAVNYTGDANGCIYHGAASVSVDPVTINNGTFTVVHTPINDELTFTGSFTSETEASGTLLIKSPSEGLCGAYEKEISWTATKGSGAESTEDTSGTVSQEDTDAIITQFFDAVNAGDVETATSLVDDNVMFSFGAQGTQFGSDNLADYLASSGLTYQVSGIQAFGGGSAQFKAVASDGTSYSFCTVLFQEGKIISLTLQP